jgi:hypothetical protein
MASYTVTAAKHATLTANTVDTVTLPVEATLVEVLNRDGAAEIYFTVDGSVPTVGGDDTQVLPASVGGLEFGSPQIAQTVVKLISSGTPKYTVRVVS